MTISNSVDPHGDHKNDEEISTSSEEESDGEDCSSYESSDDDESLDDAGRSPTAVVPQVLANPSNDSVLLVVTGASRGFGKAVTQEFCRHANVSKAVLVARSADVLHEAGEELKKISPQTQLVHHAMDLNQLNDLDNLLNLLFLHLVGCQRYGRLVLVNNAGSLGHLGPCTDAPSLQDMQASIDLNVTSSLWVSVRWARFLRDQGVHPPATLVHVSSLVAVQPFATMGIYSAGKAARDSYHQVLALENPNLHVLNYAPGPLETDMTQQIRDCASLDASLKLHYDNTLLDPTASAAVLVRLVTENKYRSGEHVDYYDVVKDEETKE